MHTEIFLVRHGETEWNSEGIFRGQSDIPLNHNGLKQAEATGSYLQKIDFAAVYCSPLSRARQTADAICLDRKITPTELKAFNDISFGPWEGKSYKELSSLHPEQMKIWQEHPHLHTLPGAETLDEVKHRAFSELERLAGKNRGKSVAIISHRVILKLLVLAALNLGSEAFWKIKQDTCCINIFEYTSDKGFIIVRVNETCHLQPLEETSKQKDF